MTALVEFVITIGSLIGLSATVLYVWFKVICGNNDVYEDDYNFEDCLITKDGEKIPYNEEDQE